jgi:hypothetical protein
MENVMKKLLALGLLLASPAAISSPLAFVQGGASAAAMTVDEEANLDAGIDGNKDKYDEDFDDDFDDERESGDRYNVSSRVGGFVQGGVGGALDYLKYDDDDSYDQTEAGVGFNLEGGLRFAPGFEVKLSYSVTSHDGTDYYDEYDDLISSDDADVSFDDFRAGFFFAPAHRSIFGYRVGLGYVRQGTDYEDASEVYEIDGFFLEGGVSLDLGRYVTINANGGFLKMADDYDTDIGGGEFKAGALFHAGPIDIGLSWRVMILSYDSDDFVDSDELYYDYRLTVGGSWGYGSRRH